MPSGRTRPSDFGISTRRIGGGTYRSAESRRRRSASQLVLNVGFEIGNALAVDSSHSPICRTLMQALARLAGSTQASNSWPIGQPSFSQSVTSPRGFGRARRHQCAGPAARRMPWRSRCNEVSVGPFARIERTLGCPVRPPTSWRQVSGHSRLWHYYEPSGFSKGIGLLFPCG